jgi:hypothetical protein
MPVSGLQHLEATAIHLGVDLFLAYKTLYRVEPD